MVHRGDTETTENIISRITFCVLHVSVVNLLRLRYDSGFRSLSMVGINSDTVGWMCMARDTTV